MTSPPWSFQIELTEGCNRLCTFCGLNGIRDKAGGPYRFLTPELAWKLAVQCADLAPEARVEFAMHGEPMMNPDAALIFSLFRAQMPKAQMQVTTNGIRFLGHMVERVEEVFSAGIDFIVLDTYRPERDKLRREVKLLAARGIAVVDFYDDWVPAGKSPWHNHRRKLQRTVVLLDDLEVRDGEVKSRVILNHAGNNPLKPALTAPLKKTCTLPFREMAIAWNGNVNICCMDWKHQYTAGVAGERTLTSIWNGDEFQAARALLQNRRRDFGPCTVCDAGSGSRAGLLPKFPPVSEAQVATVRSVEARSPNGANATFTKKRLPVV